jgi:hypothetical protein
MAALREVVGRRAITRPPRLRHGRRHPSSSEEGKLRTPPTKPSPP